MLRGTMASLVSTPNTGGKMIQLAQGHTLLRDTDVFLFDCDGVIWKGNSVIDGAAASIDKLRKAGKMIKFVTNNSMKSRAGFVKKFADMSIQVELDDIFSGSFAAAAYLAKYPMQPHQKAFVVGHAGICEELALHNIPYIAGLDFNHSKIKFGPGVKMEHDRDVGAVVVGIDTDINYFKIQYAQLCLNQNKGCRFIATNMDRVAHVTDAQEWAAAGATVGAIAGCTHTPPQLVGKPNSFLIDYITEKYHVDRSRVCMVGDNLNTDILFGLNNGLRTVLTLSGVTTRERLFSEENGIHPHYYADSIVDIV